MWEYSKYAPLFPHRETFLRKYSLGQENSQELSTEAQETGSESNCEKKTERACQLRLPKIDIDKRNLYAKARKERPANFLSTPQSVATSFSLQFRDIPLTSKSTNFNTPRIDNVLNTVRSGANSVAPGECDGEQIQIIKVEQPLKQSRVEAKQFVRGSSSLRKKEKAGTIPRKRNKEEEAVVEDTKHFLKYLKGLGASDNSEDESEKHKKKQLPSIFPKGMLKRNSIKKGEHQANAKPISTEHTESDEHTRTDSPSNRFGSEVKESKSKSNKKIMFNLQEKNNMAHLSASGGADGLSNILNEFSEKIRKSDNWVSINRGNRLREKSETRKKIMMIERNQKDEENRKKQRRSEKELREKNVNREFYNLLKKVVYNFNQLLDKFGSVRKTGLIFRNLLKRVQKEELTRMFFAADGQLIDPFNEENIEKNIMVVDYFMHDGEKFMYHKLDVSQMDNLVKLNELLEERNLQECVSNVFGIFKNLEIEQKKINQLEKDFERDISKRKLLKQIKPVGTLNLERMQLMKNSIIENLEEFERKYGSCSYISNQNRAISDSLEKVIRTHNMPDSGDFPEELIPSLQE